MGKSFHPAADMANMFIHGVQNSIRLPSHSRHGEQQKTFPFPTAYRRLPASEWRRFIFKPKLPLRFNRLLLPRSHLNLRQSILTMKEQNVYYNFGYALALEPLTVNPNALSISAKMSRISSMPTESLIRSGVTPVVFCSSSFSC